ncbi:hypothetical protein KJZ67_03675, partial [Patescibacteria group bacterium]|nr:hypothetical protein [Patescibacteria group bacterium]
SAAEAGMPFGDLFDDHFGLGAFEAWMSEEVSDYAQNRDAWFYSREEYDSPREKVLIAARHALYETVKEAFVNKPAAVLLDSESVFTEAWFEKSGRSADEYAQFARRLERYQAILNLDEFLLAESEVLTGEALTRIQGQLTMTRQLLEEIGKGTMTVIDGENFDLDIIIPNVDKSSLTRYEDALAFIATVHDVNVDPQLRRQMIVRLQQIIDDIERGSYGQYASNVREQVVQATNRIIGATKRRYQAMARTTKNDITEIDALIEQYRAELTSMTIITEDQRINILNAFEKALRIRFIMAVYGEIHDRETDMNGVPLYLPQWWYDGIESKDIATVRTVTQEILQKQQEVQAAFDVWLSQEFPVKVADAIGDTLSALTALRQGIELDSADRAADLLRAEYEQELRTPRLPVFVPEAVFIRLIEQTERNKNLEEAGELGRDVADLAGFILRTVATARREWSDPDSTPELANAVVDAIADRFTDLHVDQARFLAAWNSRVRVNIGDLQQLVEHMIAGPENTSAVDGETYARLSEPILGSIFDPMAAYLAQLSQRTAAVDNSTQGNTRRTLENAIDAYNRIAPPERYYSQRTANSPGNYDVLTSLEERLNDFLSQLEAWGMVIEAAPEQPKETEGSSQITTAGEAYVFIRSDIQQTPVILGAEENADIRFAVGQAEIGHVRMYMVDGKLFVEGIEGTVINRGSKAVPAFEVELRNRDVITLGENGPKVRILISGDTVTVKVLSLRTEQRKKKSAAVHFIEVFETDGDADDADFGNPVNDAVDMLVTNLTARLEVEDLQRSQIQAAVATGLAGGTNAINIIVQLTDEDSVLSEVIRTFTDAAGSATVILTHIPEVMEIITSSNFDAIPSELEDLIIRIKAEQQQSPVRREALTDAEAAPIVTALLAGNLDEAVRLTTELGIDGSGQLTVVQSLPVEGERVPVTVPNTLLAVVANYNAAGPAENVTAEDFLQRLLRYLSAIENDGLIVVDTEQTQAEQIIRQFAQVIGLTDSNEQRAVEAVVQLVAGEAGQQNAENVQGVLTADTTWQEPVTDHFLTVIDRADLVEALLTVYARTIISIDIDHARQVPTVLRLEQLALEALEAANSGWVRGSDETEEV